MLQSMGSQRVGYNLATEQVAVTGCRNKSTFTLSDILKHTPPQKKIKITIYIYTLDP